MDVSEVAGSHPHPYRTHTCGRLDLSNANDAVRLSGWCHRIRHLGGVAFLDLRDHYGITQVVVEPSSPAFAALGALRPETVVRVDGTVRTRPPGTENAELSTGGIELAASAIEVIGAVVGDLPMQVFGDTDYPEETRLRYRFLDLRRDRPHANVVKRSRIIRHLRHEMEARGFLELQTPILTASSPEGARDFLVPSRLHPGKFYALPQAPQQFKQLAMMSGFDRYFQIAPCFRDESARADRSPGEFYQLDIEMAFATQEDVFGVVEPVVRRLYELFGEGRRIAEGAFPRIPYAEAMLLYGSDKPDLRYGLPLADYAPVMTAQDMGLAPLAEAVAGGAGVRALRIPGGALRGGRWFKEIEGFAVAEGAKGLAHLVVREDGSLGGSLAKWLGPEAREAAFSTVHADGGRLSAGDAVLVLVEREPVLSRIAGRLRTRVASDLDLIREDAFAFCWVVDFPMYERDEETGRIDFSHNPFSMPQGGLAALDGDPLQVKAYQYDLVCNGIELSSGAIRNHRPEIMERAFALAGYDAATLESRFGGMLSALRLGAPPHGGIAPGIDRMVMMLCGEENLREVVLFPMNQRGEDLMMGAPSLVDPAQLAELHLVAAAPKRG
jgi:aspartyl-tRNA synthetase